METELPHEGLSSVEQDCNRGQLYSGKEIPGEFVVACSDCAEVLE